MALAVLLGTGRGRVASPSVGAGVAVVVVAAASVLFWTQVWGAGRGVRDSHRANAKVSAGEAERAPGSAGGANVAFLDWARHQMRAGETFYLAPAGRASDAFVYQWSTYQLLPHRHTAERDADWLVLYDVEPRKVRYDRTRFSKRLSFAPGFALVRSAHAG